MAEKSSAAEPALGIPYAYYPRPASSVGPDDSQRTTTAPAPPQQAFYVYYAHESRHQLGNTPPNALFDVTPPHDGFSLSETYYRDTPAPFECPNCGMPGLTKVKSKPSLAAFIACMMPFCLGICFLCPGMNCLWHKRHYCPNCGQKVAEFNKSDPCAVMDAAQWRQPSFAIPA